MRALQTSSEVGVRLAGYEKMWRFLSCRAVVAGSATPIATPLRTGVKWRLRSSAPVEELQRRVGQLVGMGDVDEAVQVIRAGLSRSVFSMKALANTLFLCERTKREALATELIEQVHMSGLVQSWDDESVLAVALRLRCAAGDAKGAMQIFSYIVSHKFLRLRSVSAFLHLCCTRRDRQMAFAVYDEALRQGIELRVEDYHALGRLCVDVGEPISTLHRLLREMQGHMDSVSETMVEEVIRPWSTRGGLRVVDVTFPNNDTTLSAGMCCNCSRNLSGHRFTAVQKSSLIGDVVKVATSSGRKDSARAWVAFEAWRRFVSAHGSRIDVLIDGANLGYYGLSSWYSIAKRELLMKRGRRAEEIQPQELELSKRGFVDVSVSFELIGLAVNEARRRGLRPLVILHSRHCEPKNMTAESEALAAEWRRDGVLYCTPNGLNDDLCWLYAALELTTPTDTATAAGAAKTVWVLTNDLMRDHHFKLLSPRYFVRWRDRHRIAFKCERKDGRTLLHWEMPAPYARCIQEPSHLNWHIPVGEPCCEAKGEGDVSRTDTEAAGEATRQDSPPRQSCAWTAGGFQTPQRWLCVC